MMKQLIYRNNKGVSLVELLIVLVVVGILAGFGVPQYLRFAAKNNVRAVANEVMQNMRLLRTMAIKENRPYRIEFESNCTGTATRNFYCMGYDGNDDDDIYDTVDGYGSSFPAKDIDVQRVHGSNVIIGRQGYPTRAPPNGATTLTEQAVFNFMEDGSSEPNGFICFQHTVRGYTFCVELATTAGTTNLFMWHGDEDTPLVSTWEELR
jgi:prepilin-type N-terminal cleavage/methylation domain-containing protein